MFFKANNYKIICKYIFGWFLNYFSFIGKVKFQLDSKYCN